MSEWISVKDRLPKPEETVLCLLREIEFYGRHKEHRQVYRSVYIGYQIDGEWATQYCYGYKDLEDTQVEHPEFKLKVTHWMPIPELPKFQGGNNDE